MTGKDVLGYSSAVDKFLIGGNSNSTFLPPFPPLTRTFARENLVTKGLIRIQKKVVMAPYFLLVYAVVLSVVAAGNGVTQDQCNPLLNLGGLVFPEYSRRSVEHALHWSKAQSERLVASFHFLLFCSFQARSRLERNSCSGRSAFIQRRPLVRF